MADGNEVVEMRRRKRRGCRHNNQIKLARAGVNRKCLLARLMMVGADGVRPNDTTIIQSDGKMVTAREETKRTARVRGREGQWLIL